MFKIFRFRVSLDLHTILVSCIILSFANADDLPTCQPHDFHYEYTECDSTGGRWRVSVPDPNKCTGGAPNPPIRGKGCDFTCNEGEYLDIQGDQECHACPAGTYSLGGGNRFDDWEKLPNGFGTKMESFSGPGYMAGFGAFNKISKLNQKQNCTAKSGWTTNGKSVAVLPSSGCRFSLIYTANLVKPGTVKFTYQFSDKSSVLQFEVQNNECQTIQERNRGIKWPPALEEGEWNTVAASLKSGMNILTWIVYQADETKEQSLKKTIAIKSIEITGIAYTSECMKCRAGTWSAQGASECSECPEGSYSGRGAIECSSCVADYQYSFAGSSNCTDMELCTTNDYYAFNSPCDANNMTKKSYRWIKPKICRDGVQGAVSLPLDSLPESCPPCNPGMQLLNKTCQFCPAKTFSDGTGPCQSCPGSTAPKIGIVYKWWNNMPASANLSAYCLSVTEHGCASDEGWQGALDHIHSGQGHADDVYLVLTFKVGGFQGQNQVLGGKAVALGEITFTFETKCTSDCSFVFMTQNQEEGTYIIKSWEGSQELQAYSYKVTSSEPLSFIWAYQKIDVTAKDEMYGKPEYKYKDDQAMIYSINVTNTLDGGATACQTCPVGTNQEGCIPCPAGQVVDANTNECKLCPAHMIARGQSSCEPCGSGLKTNDNIKCETMCKVNSPDGKEYDFTSLAGVQTVEGTRLFTSGGTPYYHLFNISLCGGSYSFPLVTCSDNMTLPGGATPIAGDAIKSTVCRATVIPPIPGQEEFMSAQPVSIGDSLVNITTNGSLLNINARMEEGGFQKDEYNLDVHFVYVSNEVTSGCLEGRTTIMTMRCDPAQSDTGTIQLPPRCSDGTCDGCNFHFLWRSKKACPVCNRNEYQEIKSECKDSMQTVTYIPPQHCMMSENIEAMNKKLPCTVQWPLWLQIVVYGVPVLVVLVVFFIILTIYCCMKNQKLEYKYMKLAAGAGSKDGNYDRLPEAETCALEDGEDEQSEDVHFRDANKSSKFFNKLKNLGGKKEDNPFEDVKLSEKIPLT